MRDSFVFYRSFFEAIDELPIENQAHLYKAIASYALNSEIVNLTQWENALFKTICPQLDANQKRYENGCKGEKYGKLGGAPKGNKNAKKQPQNNPKITPNVNDNDNVNEIIVVNNNSNNQTKKNNIKEKRFIKPAIEEIAAYCEERNNTVDAQRFYDFYESKGWKVGNTPMKDWKAAIRTWEGNERRRNQNTSKVCGDIPPPNDDWSDIVIE